MKALVRQEQVLLYHLEETGERGAQLRQILRREGIAVREIREEMLGQSLGFCAGEAGFPADEGSYNGPVFPEEVLVFYGITGKRLDQLLRMLKEIPGGPVALKAVVTQHNKAWPVGALFEELQKEHRLMAKMREVQAEMLRWEAQDVTAAPQECQSALRDALRDAKAMLKRGSDVTEALCEQKIKTIRAAGADCMTGKKLKKGPESGCQEV